MRRNNNEKGKMLGGNKGKREMGKNHDKIDIVVSPL